MEHTQHTALPVDARHAVGCMCRHGWSADKVEEVFRIAVDVTMQMLREDPELTGHNRVSHYHYKAHVLNMVRMKEVNPKATWVCASAALFEWGANQDPHQSMQVP